MKFIKSLLRQRVLHICIQGMYDEMDGTMPVINSMKVANSQCIVDLSLHVSGLKRTFEIEIPLYLVENCKKVEEESQDEENLRLNLEFAINSLLDATNYVVGERASVIATQLEKLLKYQEFFAVRPMTPIFKGALKLAMEKALDILDTLEIFERSMDDDF